MKKQIILLVLLCFYFSAYAIEKTSILDRLNNPTYIVLDSQELQFANAFKESIQSYWTINPYQFITIQEFESLKKNESALFLVKNNNQQVKDESTLVCKEVIQLIYFKKEGKLVNQIAGAPIIITQSNDALSILNAVRIVHDKLSFLIVKENEKSNKNYKKLIQTKTNIIKVNKLYISSEDLVSDVDTNSLKKIYSEIYIVSKDDLFNIIYSKVSGSAYLILSHQQTSKLSYVNSKKIILASTGELLYSNTSTSVHPKKIKIKDFEFLQKL